MTQPDTRQRAVIENLLPRYRAEGFQVFVNPPRSMLPPFMESYRPNAVALKLDKKIAIEVVRPNQPSTRKVEDLKSLFAPHSDWELRVFYVSPLFAETTLDVVSPGGIQSAIQQVLDLKKDGHLVPALIMAWAALEAIGRALLPSELRRPQTPERVIEVLAGEGYLTPEEADALRPAIPIRNAVHGAPGPTVDTKQLDHFVAVLRALVGFLPTEAIGIRGETR